MGVIKERIIKLSKSKTVQEISVLFGLNVFIIDNVINGDKYTAETVEKAARDRVIDEAVKRAKPLKLWL